MHTITRTVTATLTAGALALGLTACSSSEDSKTITLGYMPAWTDIEATTYLYKHKLEEAGYEVELEEVSDAAVIYTALGNGDFDMFSSAWIERTHDKYYQEVKDEVEDLGVFGDYASNFLAVPEYSELNSIEDLKDKAGDYDGTITGIEPGAGLTEMVQSSVFPAYDLEGEGYELVTSSTPAMLSELQTALDNKEDIITTLWSPYWAYTKYPVKKLEDPKGAFGEPEGMHILGRGGFTEEYPEVATWASEIEFTEDEFGHFEDLFVNEYGDGKEEEAIAAWLEENPDKIPDIPAAE